MAKEIKKRYECKVCGRQIDVTRTGDVYEEPVFCCGVEATEIDIKGKNKLTGKRSKVFHLPEETESVNDFETPRGRI